MYRLRHLPELLPGLCHNGRKEKGRKGKTITNCEAAEKPAAFVLHLFWDTAYNTKGDFLMSDFVCLFCESEKRGNNELAVCGQYICLNCEQKITNLSLDDPSYEFYTSGFKKMWRWIACFSESGEDILRFNLARR